MKRTIVLPLRDSNHMMFEQRTHLAQCQEHLLDDLPFASLSYRHSQKKERQCKHRPTISRLITWRT